jgi:predicted HTH domain antitoxin
MEKTVQIRIPKEIYDVLEFYKIDKELDKDIKLLLAVELFSKGYLTLEQASKLAGIPIADFIDELSRRGIPIFEYSEEELRKEIENVDSI